MRKSIIKTMVIGCLLLGASATTAFGAYEGYTDYLIYTNLQNNYTSYHAKKNNNDLLKNYITSLSSISAVDFWACDDLGTAPNDHRIISDLYTWKKSDLGATYAKNINFLSKYNKSIGNKVALGMENQVSSSTVGKVSGYVDFN